MRSPRSGADGVVGIAEVFRNALFRRFHYRPPRPLLYKEASRLLLDVASTPPESGGEWRSPSFVLDQRNTRGHRPRLQSISTFCNTLKLGGEARSAREVRSKLRSLRFDIREALLIIHKGRLAVIHKDPAPRDFEQTAPAAARPPRLT